MTSLETNDLGARVSGICDPSSPDFCCTVEQLNAIAEEVAIREQILEDNQKNLNGSLHSTSSQNSNFSRELEELNALALVVRLQILFTEFDSNLGDREYCKCSDYYAELTNIVQEIAQKETSVVKKDLQSGLENANNTGEDVNMNAVDNPIPQSRNPIIAILGPTGLNVIQHSLLQYRQRRVLFSSRIERCFTTFFSFLPSTMACGVADECNTIGTLWEALCVLNLRERKAKYIAEEITHNLLEPMFRRIYSESLEKGCPIAPKIFQPHDAITVWSFVEVNKDTVSKGDDSDDGAIKGTNRPGVSSSATPPNIDGYNVQSQSQTLSQILNVLHSLVEYLFSVVCATLPDVFLELGSLLWPRFLGYLKRCAGGSEVLLEFEERMVGLGFIAVNDNRLRNLAHERKSGVQKRTKVLEQIRNVMLTQDMSTTRVSDFSTGAMQGIDQNLHDFIFPTCSVSSSIMRLISELKSAVETGAQDALISREQQVLSRQLISLFILVRPHVHRRKLVTEPYFSGVFYNDCQYLAYILTILPFSKHGPMHYTHHAGGQPISWLVDFVPQLRQLGESHLSGMLNYVKAEMLSLNPEIRASGVVNSNVGGELGGERLTEENFFAQVSLDSRYAQTESALSISLQFLKTVLSSLSAVMPKKLLGKITFLLTEHLLCRLLNRLLSAQAVDEADQNCLSYLFGSVKNQIDQLLNTGEGRDDVEMGYYSGMSDSNRAFLDVSSPGGQIGGTGEEVGVAGPSDVIRKKRLTYHQAVCTIIPMLEDTDFEFVRQELNRLITLIDEQNIIGQ